MKKYILASLLFCMTVVGYAQGFSSFSAEGSLQPATIKNVINGFSTIEVIVGEKTDLKNVDFHYRLLSGCSLSKELSKDFSQPQKVTITKSNGDSKEWLIFIKKLRPAPLPVELVFSETNPSVWTPETIGWAGNGVDTEKSTVIRFGNKGVSFWVSFDKPATKVDYQLKMVSKEKVDFDGDFLVETSADGRKWNILAEFDENNKLTMDGNYRHGISKDVRFIRWTYVTRNKLNLNLNNIYVTAE